MVKCWGSPQPHSSPETKAGGCKVWQFGLQILCPSTTQAGPQHPSASVPQPHEVRRRPSFQPPVCPGPPEMGPVLWARWSLKLGEVGQRGGGVGAPVPRLVVGGVKY